MIRAVFFDYDGVLTRDKTGSLTTCRSLARQTGLPFEAIHAALRPHNEALNLGHITHAQVWPEVCQALGRDVPITMLQTAFESTPLNDEMLALARTLKCHHHVGLITDNKRDRIEHLRVFQRLDAVFHPIVVSAEVGSSKEGAAIFERALAHLTVSPAQAVFIDNSPANLVAPAALGLRTVHFDDERNDVRALTATLRGLGLVLP